MLKLCIHFMDLTPRDFVILANTHCWWCLCLCLCVQSNYIWMGSLNRCNQVAQTSGSVFRFCTTCL